MGTQHVRDLDDFDCCGNLATARRTSVVTVAPESS